MDCRRNLEGGRFFVKTKELIDFISNLVPGRYSPNSFPLESKYDDWVAVKLTGGFPVSQWTGKKQPSFQVRVRGNPNVAGSNEPFDTEDRANEIHQVLTNLRDVKIGESNIVLIRAMNSYPLNLGHDENNRPIYSMNFDTVIRPK